MTAVYTPVPTASPGDVFSASYWNTYIRDNMAALWPYAAAGDFIVAAGSPVAAQVVGKPSATKIATMDSTGVLTWIASNLLSGMLHAKGSAEFTTNQAGTGGGNWIDITNSGITLTLTAVCTIVLIAATIGYADSIPNTYALRSVIDGTTGINIAFNEYKSIARNEAVPDVYIKTGVAAGSRSTKLQFATGSGQHTQGRCIALAFVE